MSERIDELIGKALDQAVPYTWHHLNRVQMDDVMKKFAELIVEECAEMFDKDEIEPTLTERTIHSMIKEHFGVEK